MAIASLKTHLKTLFPYVPFQNLGSDRSWWEIVFFCFCEETMSVLKSMSFSSSDANEESKQIGELYQEQKPTIAPNEDHIRQTK